MKRITITGNLGKDAECREGQGGHKFVSFSVAYAERDTDAKDEPVSLYTSDAADE